jgi:hypothetical protein
MGGGGAENEEYLSDLLQIDTATFKVSRRLGLGAARLAVSTIHGQCSLGTAALFRRAEPAPNVFKSGSAHSPP